MELKFGKFEKVSLEETKQDYNLIKQLYERKRRINEEKNKDKNAYDLNSGYQFLDFNIVRIIENGKTEFDFGDELKTTLAYARSIAKRVNQDKDLLKKLEAHKKEVLTRLKKVFVGSQKYHYDNIENDLSFIKNKRVEFDIYKIEYDLSKRGLFIINKNTKKIVSPNFGSSRKLNSYVSDVCTMIKSLIDEFYRAVAVINKMNFDDEDFHFEIPEKIVRGFDLFKGHYEKSRKEAVKSFFGYEEEELQEEETKNESNR